MSEIKPDIYKTKPVMIKAMLWDGTAESTIGVIAFSKGKVKEGVLGCAYLYVDTLEGVMQASVGDFIIEGLLGEFYPCKPDVFHKKYELVIPVKGDVL